jgi:hypothetical protein
MLTLLVLGLALLSAAETSQAQQPSPQELQQMEMMIPMMGKMMDSMYTSVLRTYAKPETAAQLATFMKNYRDALVAKGFTKEEALEIVKAAGIPAMPSSK